MSPKPAPPRFAEAILAWFAPANGLGESILGDLREEFVHRAESGSRPGASMEIQDGTWILSKVPGGPKRKRTPSRRSIRTTSKLSESTHTEGRRRSSPRDERGRRPPST